MAAGKQPPPKSPQNTIQLLRSSSKKLLASLKDVSATGLSPGTELLDQVTWLPSWLYAELAAYIRYRKCGAIRMAPWAFASFTIRRFLLLPNADPGFLRKRRSSFSRPMDEPALDGVPFNAFCVTIVFNHRAQTPYTRGRHRKKQQETSYAN